MSFIFNLFNHYGYIILFCSFVLELIAVPTPGEALMTYAGFLSYQGKLNWTLSVLVASAGVIIGITISHFVGRKLGVPFFTKYGHYVHMGPEKLEKTSKWFDKYGERLLMIAYFIPGVRHITGYFSGITGVPFKKFAINAYLGAVIWTSTFILLGKALGPEYSKIDVYVKKYLIIACIILALFLLLIYLYRSHKNEIDNYVLKHVDKSLKVFHSLGRIKIAILILGVGFLGLFALVIGMIQDYLANEFSQFDLITSLVIKMAFSEKGLVSTNLYLVLTSFYVMVPLSLLLIVWILWKEKRHTILEIQSLVATIYGGWLLSIILRLLFHRVGPSGQILLENIKYTFPSLQTLMAVVVYGFASFIIIRHTGRKSFGTLLGAVTFVICLFVGISAVFNRAEYPSDVAAGYVFGGVWLSLNIILLEVYRVLPKSNVKAE